jgi:hypothetical protein
VRNVSIAIDVTDAQLDALEVRGYLDPDRRGDRNEEQDGSLIEIKVADRVISGGGQCPLWVKN